jgi:hypothetical protein
MLEREGERGECGDVRRGRYFGEGRGELGGERQRQRWRETGKKSDKGKNTINLILSCIKC